MPRFKVLAYAGLLMALPGARPAPAQTQAVAHLAVQSGNGQAACQCLSATLQTYQPITVKATDANGNPVANATVTWTVTSGQITVGTTTTTTLSDGTSSNTLNIVLYTPFTSEAAPYLVSTIQAAANNNSVIFTETQALVTTSDVPVIFANLPAVNGVGLLAAPLSGAAGTTNLSSPIQVFVGGSAQASDGVANVSVRIFNTQASPTLTCGSTGGSLGGPTPVPYADPGSVLSDTKGNANCYPEFNGSGTGTYYVLVGGVPGTDTKIADALDLQQYGPYAFTSIPGAPTQLQIISGNNQVGGIGQPLNPMVVELEDVNGNAVQNQALTWTVTPAGSAAINANLTPTDNNGQASSAVELFLGASSGCKIVVALQSNPSISVTFQETVAGTITSLNKISGDAQSAQMGTSFLQPLVVQVTSSAGPLQNYPLQFVTSGPVSLPLGSTVGTNASGEVSITVAAGATTGKATVTAVAGILTQTFNLTVTSTPTAPPPNGMTLVSGTPQSAIVNTAFASPLIVQVTSTAGPVVGYVVNYSTNSGDIILSSSTATTGSNGQAQITVQAGSTAGTASVTASIPGGFTQTFNLTVSPPGPTLTANSFANAASGQVGAISPCSLATISAAGLTPAGISALSPAPVFGRLPYSVNGLSVTFAGLPAPIVNVAMGSVNPQVTVQVPCEVTPGASVPVTVNVGAGSSSISIPVQSVSPGIFQTAMSDGVSRAVVVRSDGSFADVGGTPPNPARRNEYVRIYLTGMGPTTPFVDTDSIQDPNADLVGTDATVAGVVQAGIVGGGGLQVITARLAPDLIGVYEVQIAIPGSAPTGNSVQIAISVVPVGAASAVSSIAALIPIQ